MQNDKAWFKIKFPEFQGRHVFMLRRELTFDFLLVSDCILSAVFPILFQIGIKCLK